MTKFKVGDKVRLVGEKWASYDGYNATPFDPCAVYTVDSVEKQGVFAGNAGLVYYPGEGRSPLGYEVELIEETDATNPSHYAFPGGAEVIDITRHLGFLEGNVIKYVARAGRKGESRREDLRKAKVFLDFELKRLGAQ